MSHTIVTSCRAHTSAKARYGFLHVSVIRPIARFSSSGNYRKYELACGIYVPLRTLHLGHISSLMLAWCKEGTVSQVLSY